MSQAPDDPRAGWVRRLLPSAVDRPPRVDEAVSSPSDDPELTRRMADAEQGVGEALRRAAASEARLAEAEAMIVELRELLRAAADPTQEYVEARADGPAASMPSADHPGALDDSPERLEIGPATDATLQAQDVEPAPALDANPVPEPPPQPQDVEPAPEPPALDANPVPEPPPQPRSLPERPLPPERRGTAGSRRGGALRWGAMAARRLADGAIDRRARTRPAPGRPQPEPLAPAESPTPPLEPPVVAKASAGASDPGPERSALHASDPHTRSETAASEGGVEGPPGPVGGPGLVGKIGSLVARHRLPVLAAIVLAAALAGGFLGWRGSAPSAPSASVGAGGQTARAPSPAQAMQDYVDQVNVPILALNEQRPGYRRALAAADTTAGRVRYSMRLSREYRVALDALTEVSPPAPARGLHQSLLSAMTRARDAYGPLASAARTRNGAAFSAAARRVRESEAAVQQSLARIEGSV